MKSLFVDTNTLVYAFGAEHPLRHACRHLLEEAQAGRVRIHISTEGVQEFLHHRLRRTTRDQAVAEAHDLVALCVLHDISERVITDMLSLVEASPSLEGRDAVHAATALAGGFTEIVSADSDLDAVPGLTRVDPRNLIVK